MKKNIVIIILTILVLGLGAFIGYDKFIKEQPKCEENETNKLINFDITKCINNDLKKNWLDGSPKGTTIVKSGIGITNTIWYEYGDSDAVVSEEGIQEVDKKIISFHANYKELYGNSTTTDKESEIVKLKFDKNVESIYEGGLSINMGGVWFFLLEDGTVEYMRLSDIYLSQKFEHHKLEGVKDIVKFETITTNSYGGKITTIAYKMDGTFYDLSKYGILDGDGINR